MLFGREPRIIKALRLTSGGRCTMVSSGSRTLASRREPTRWSGEGKFNDPEPLLWGRVAGNFAFRPCPGSNLISRGS